METLEILRYADTETLRSGDSETLRCGDRETWRHEYRVYGVDAVRTRVTRIQGNVRPADAWNLLAVWHRWPACLRSLARWRSAVAGLPLSAACLDVACAVWRAEDLSGWRSVVRMTREMC